eukprot:COSAG01_NODE_13028_length_1646_cov_3.340013_1_plen_82_part_10
MLLVNRHYIQLFLSSPLKIANAVVSLIQPEFSTQTCTDSTTVSPLGIACTGVTATALVSQAATILVNWWVCGPSAHQQQQRS